MSAIRLKLNFVHDFVHDFNTVARKKPYSGPYTYDGGGDLTKRWYVYYSFRHPDTGKLVRQDNIDVGVNEHKNKKERYKALYALQEAIAIILADGHNPYQSAPLPEEQIKKTYTVTEAIDFALDIAKELYAATSYPDFKSRLTQFKEWAATKGHKNTDIKELEDVHIIQYLNTVLKKSSARNRNNARTALSSFYRLLRDNKIIKHNIVENINVLSAKPEKNRSFSPDQEEKILNRILEDNPYLFLFIGFISINLLRPIEICRLRIEDISIKDRLIRYQAKNQKLKTRIIPEMLLQELPDLTRFNKSDYLFTPYGPGPSDTTEVNRRNFYSEQFKKVKDALGLGKEYGLYSFRHTYILKLFRELRKTYSPFEAKSRLMHITGHTSMKALEAYLREIDAELPEDYSHLLEQANKKAAD